MKKQIVSIALLIAVMTSFAFAPIVGVKAAPPVPSASFPVNTTYTDSLGGTGTFTGTLDLNRFAIQDGGIVAFGTLTGTVTDDVTGIVREISQQVTLPVSNISATCEILHLELGPLDLNLLGLVVHLDRIVLDITAQQGGGLLGDLLCSLADLLDNGNAALRAVVQLLNNILNILG